MGHFVRNAFSFFGDLVQQRTSELMRAFAHAANKWIDVSVSVGKLAMRFWCGEEASTISAPHTAAEAPIIAENVAVTHVEDVVAKMDEDEDEDETALEVFVQDKRPRRARKQHNGVQRSSKKKGSKGRAAFSLRGVNGEVATPP